MTKAISFVRLDLITVKPYLNIKTLLALIVTGGVMMFTNDSIMAAVTVVMCFGAIFSSYPFVVGEKSSIDVLYSTLSIKRDTVVLGRYLFALTMDFGAALMANAIAFSVYTATGRAFNPEESFLYTGIMFLVFGFAQAIQIPIYFKLGYTKAKFLAYMPLIIMPLAMFMLTDMFKSLFTQVQLENFMGWVNQNPVPVGIFAVAAWVILLNISYRISLMFYRKKDL